MNFSFSYISRNRVFLFSNSESQLNGFCEHAQWHCFKRRTFHLCFEQFQHFRFLYSFSIFTLFMKLGFRWFNFVFHHMIFETRKDIIWCRECCLCDLKRFWNCHKFWFVSIFFFVVHVWVRVASFWIFVSSRPLFVQKLSFLAPLYLDKITFIKNQLPNVF